MNSMFIINPDDDEVEQEGVTEEAEESAEKTSDEAGE